jgi:hypothetical protein
MYIGKVLWGCAETLLFSYLSSESEWNKKAKSPRNAKGPWQILDRTYKWINEYKLDKFGNQDIWNVFHNSEAAIRYQVFNRQLMKWKLGRKPTPMELAWAYHAGAQAAIDAIVTGKPTKYLAPDTVAHGHKVMYYYKSYLQGKYQVYWYAYLREKRRKKSR